MWLTELDLNDNQIVDVSGLTLTEGLTVLYLGNNQIVVSYLTQLSFLLHDDSTGSDSCLLCPDPMNATAAAGSTFVANCDVSGPNRMVLTVAVVQ